MVRNDQRVESASSFHHKHKSRNFSSNSSAISRSLSGRSGCSDQPGPAGCQNFTLGVTLDFTDYMRRPWSQVEESPFFRLLLSSSKLCSNWQLTACCLQLPACTLNAKLTISSCQTGWHKYKHAHIDDDFGERAKRRERRKKWSRLLFTPFLPLCFSFFCSLRLVLLFELFF